MKDIDQPATLARKTAVVTPSDLRRFPNKKIVESSQEIIIWSPSVRGVDFAAQQVAALFHATRVCLRVNRLKTLFLRY
jgi:hypothetical protein